VSVKATLPLRRHAELVSASIVPFTQLVLAERLILKHVRDDLRRGVRVSKQPCVYILASQPYGTLYIGVTSDLIARLYQHRTDAAAGFTSRHGVHSLIRFELCDTMEAAILREKQLKRWRRQWKINLIESDNPQWVDLSVGVGLPPIAHRMPSNGC
jgi:putative endonuclease